MYNLCFVSISASIFASDIHAINDKYGNIFFSQSLVISANLEDLTLLSMCMGYTGTVFASLSSLEFSYRLYILKAKESIRSTIWRASGKGEKVGMHAQVCTRVACEASYSCNKKLLEQALMIHFL